MASLVLDDDRYRDLRDALLSTSPLKTDGYQQGTGIFLGIVIPIFFNHEESEFQGGSSWEEHPAGSQGRLPF